MAFWWAIVSIKTYSRNIARKKMKKNSHSCSLRLHGQHLVPVLGPFAPPEAPCETRNPKSEGRNPARRDECRNPKNPTTCRLFLISDFGIRTSRKSDFSDSC